MNPGLALCCTIQHPWHDQNGVLFDPLNRAIRDSYCMVCWNMETETGQVCRSERTISCCIRLGHIVFFYPADIAWSDWLCGWKDPYPIPPTWVFGFFIFLSHVGATMSAALRVDLQYLRFLDLNGCVWKWFASPIYGHQILREMMEHETKTSWLNGYR